MSYKSTDGLMRHLRNNGIEFLFVNLKNIF